MIIDSIIAWAVFVVVGGLWVAFIFHLRNRDRKAHPQDYVHDRTLSQMQRGAHRGLLVGTQGARWSLVDDEGEALP